MLLTKYKIFSIIYLLTFILLGSNNLLYSAQYNELEIYNEWFSHDSDLRPEKPFFFIRSTREFHHFWKDSRLSGFPPHLDFNKYMIFVWAPKPTRKDCSQVEIEKLIIKDGACLILMNFKGYDKVILGPSKRPVKAAIFPLINDADTFIFTKIKKGWEQYEWKPIYTIWDMEKSRTRPFQYVYMDKEPRPVYEMASYSTKIEIAQSYSKNNSNTNEPVKSSEPVVYSPPISDVSMPKQLPEAQNVSNQINNSIPANSQAKKQQPVSTSAPISIGSDTPASKELSSTNEVAPGMGEDPLFGSEFDITF